MPDNEQSIIRQRDANSRNLLDYMNEKRREGVFNDVMINVGASGIPANKVVLSCYSKYFGEIFESSLSGNLPKTLELVGFEIEAVEQIVEFVYTGYISINSENVRNLLATADYLQVDDVREFCFEYLAATTSMDNMSTMILTLKMFKNDLLSKHFGQFFKQNLNIILRSSFFRELTKPTMALVVTNLNKMDDEDTSAYEAIKAWINFDKEERQTEFPDLLKLLDLGKLPLDYLEDVVANDDLVKDNNVCLNAVMSCITKQFKEMRFKETGSLILSIGGHKPPSGVVEVYNSVSSVKTCYPDLPIDLLYSSSVRHSNFIYHIGGSSDIEINEVSSNVFRLNIKATKMEWKEVASMNGARAFAGAAVFNDCLVVTGGMCKNNELNLDTELYIPALNKWQLLSRLNYPRAGNALVHCKGSLYALGGNDGENYLDSVERLSYLDRNWETVAPMQTARYFFAAVELNGYIYAIGGKCACNNGTEATLASVEKFDPTEGSWKYVSDMNFGRKYHAACVLHDKIFVLGGSDLKGRPVKAIEWYDASRNVWSIVGEAMQDFASHSLVVV